jgi:hypothetical protein
VYFITSFKILSGPADFPFFKSNIAFLISLYVIVESGSNEQENIPEILKDKSVIIEHFLKQGNPSHFNSNFKKEIENQLKNMEEDGLVYFITSFKILSGPADFPFFKSNIAFLISLYVIVESDSAKSWKELFTIPIYKSGDKNDPNNYRGVSLINCLPKIFNTILNNRISSYRN